MYMNDVPTLNGNIAGKIEMSPKTLGRYIVADPRICHGKPTFRGTRIMVADVLEQVASGMAWKEIGAEWHGKVSEDAIREAIELARKAFLQHIDELEPELVLA